MQTMQPQANQEDHLLYATNQDFPNGLVLFKKIITQPWTINVVEKKIIFFFLFLFYFFWQPCLRASPAGCCVQVGAKCSLHRSCWVKDIVVTKDKQKIELEEKTNKVSHKLVDTLDAKKEKYSCQKKFESGTVFSPYMLYWMCKWQRSCRALLLLWEVGRKLVESVGDKGWSCYFSGCGKVGGWVGFFVMSVCVRKM